MDLSNVQDLGDLAKKEKCVFYGSTSTLTSCLSQIFFMIGRWKEINTSMLSTIYAEKVSHIHSLSLILSGDESRADSHRVSFPLFAAHELHLRRQAPCVRLPQVQS